LNSSNAYNIGEISEKVKKSFWEETRREMFDSQESLRRVLEAAIDEGYKVELEVVIEQIRALDRSIERITDELKKKARTLKGHRNLTSITGIADVTAAILSNAIGDVNDFSSAKKLAAYLGMAPRAQISSGTRH